MSFGVQSAVPIMEQDVQWLEVEEAKDVLDKLDKGDTETLWIVGAAIDNEENDRKEPAR